MSIAAGAVYALGFAPLGFFPALLLGLAALVLVLDGAMTRPRRTRTAFALGWGFGFGQFVVGMHWIFYPFLVDPLAHAWQIPFVALLFPGGLALFSALACLAAAQFWRPRARILVFTACYAAAEWLRGHVLTGLPWNLPAYGWGASLAILQSAAAIGAYGLSLLTVLFGASLADLFGHLRKPVLPAMAAALFVAMWIGGAARLASTPTQFVPGVQLRLVQPNVPQDQKYVRSLVTRNWRTLMELSQRPARIAPTIIVWPEAAPPVLLQRSPDALAQIAMLTGSSRVLMTGNQRVAFPESGGRQVFNSLFVFGPDGARLAAYDKFHLVPFGEFLPMEALLSRIGVSKLVDFPGSFTAGDGPHTIALPQAPSVGPLICYEILFPGAVTEKGTRPGWLANVTDDSWFGPWAGPRQHFLSARVRAIEEGLPVARAANTGISSVIDGDGRVLAVLDLDKTGIVDSPLPQAQPETPYARYGDLLFFVMLFAMGALSWAAARK